ncbi:MAG: hypothetical protein KDB03_22545 [Planctomycetales bacterium]|nr:hypothetical protein [Planctomycetales bacterium]
MKSQHLGLCSLLWILCTAVGCGPPEFCRVEGIVTHKGKPVPFLQISFSPVDPELVRPPLGFSDKEGKFQMRTARTEGVKRGEYHIFVDDPERVGGGRTSTEPDYLYVIDRYSAENTDITVDFQNHQDNFELKLD